MLDNVIQYLIQRGRFGDLGMGDTVKGDRLFAQLPRRAHHLIVARRRANPAQCKRHHADTDDFLVVRIQPGGLKIQRQIGKLRQRRVGGGHTLAVKMLQCRCGAGLGLHCHIGVPVRRGFGFTTTSPHTA